MALNTRGQRSMVMNAGPWCMQEEAFLRIAHTVSEEGSVGLWASRGHDNIQQPIMYKTEDSVICTAKIVDKRFQADFNETGHKFVCNLCLLVLGA